MSMTPKQERFAAEYVRLNSASEAYRLVYDAKDWTDGSVQSEASRALAVPEVASRVRELRAAAIAPTIASAAWIVDMAARIASKQEDDDPRAAIQALKLLAQRLPEWANPLIDARRMTIQLPEGTSLDDLRALRDQLQSTPDDLS